MMWVDNKSQIVFNNELWIYIKIMFGYYFQIKKKRKKERMKEDSEDK